MELEHTRTEARIAAAPTQEVKTASSRRIPSPISVALRSVKSISPFGNMHDDDMCDLTG